MTSIRDLRHHAGTIQTLNGWVYNLRTGKGLLFVILRDGSGLCQCVVGQEQVGADVWEAVNTLTQESAVQLTGTVVADERSLGGYELHVTSAVILQIASDYPITPKDHGVEFLMENRHLWLRSQRQWAIMRVRNQIIWAIHRFFQERGFIQMDAPIFTGNAVEGTSTLFETDYFDQKAYLTQSGQLYGEAMAIAHSKIYTFGPTFRAEKSKTRRHLTEFWMIEPEMAFYDLPMNMDLAEEMIRYIVTDVLATRQDELAILKRDLSYLSKITQPFPRITYSEAIERLRSDATSRLLDTMQADRIAEHAALSAEGPELEKEAGQAKKFRKTQIDARLREIRSRLEEIDEDLRNIPVWRESALGKQWGDDLGGSDETLLTMQYETPILVWGYPSVIKAFYMKRDPHNDAIALGVDMLAPEGYGEIIGGGQREDNLDLLLERIREHDLPESVFHWYLDLRRYGSVPHAGFGLGLERTVAWICGLKHVRETIPFPRMLGRLHP